MRVNKTKLFRTLVMVIIISMISPIISPIIARGEPVKLLSDDERKLYNQMSELKMTIEKFIANRPQSQVTKSDYLIILTMINQLRFYLTTYYDNVIGINDDQDISGFNKYLGDFILLEQNISQTYLSDVNSVFDTEEFTLGFVPSFNIREYDNAQTMLSMTGIWKAYDEMLTAHITNISNRNIVVNETALTEESEGNLGNVEDATEVETQQEVLKGDLTEIKGYLSRYRGTISNILGGMAYHINVSVVMNEYNLKYQGNTLIPTDDVSSRRDRYTKGHTHMTELLSILDLGKLDTEWKPSYDFVSVTGDVSTIYEQSSRLLLRHYLEMVANSAVYRPFLTNLYDSENYTHLSQEAQDLHKLWGSYRKPLYTFDKSIKHPARELIYKPDNVKGNVELISLQDFVDRVLDKKQIGLFLANDNIDDFRNTTNKKAEDVDVSETGSSTETQTTTETKAKFSEPVYILGYDNLEPTFNAGVKISMESDKTQKKSDSKTAMAVQKVESARANFVTMTNVLRDRVHEISELEEEMYRPIYMDIYGNIVTERGYVIVPAIVNATLYSNGTKPSALNSTFMNHYPEFEMNGSSVIYNKALNGKYVYKVYSTEDYSIMGMFEITEKKTGFFGVVQTVVDKWEGVKGWFRRLKPGSSVTRQKIVTGVKDGEDYDWDKTKVNTEISGVNHYAIREETVKPWEHRILVPKTGEDLNQVAPDETEEIPQENDPQDEYSYTDEIVEVGSDFLIYKMWDSKNLRPAGTSEWFVDYKSTGVKVQINLDGRTVGMGLNNLPDEDYSRMVVQKLNLIYLMQKEGKLTEISNSTLNDGKFIDIYNNVLLGSTNPHEMVGDNIISSAKGTSLEKTAGGKIASVLEPIYVLLTRNPVFNYAVYNPVLSEIPVLNNVANYVVSVSVVILALTVIFFLLTYLVSYNKDGGTYRTLPNVIASIMICIILIYSMKDIFPYVANMGFNGIPRTLLRDNVHYAVLQEQENRLKSGMKRTHFDKYSYANDIRIYPSDFVLNLKKLPKEEIQQFRSAEGGGYKQSFLYLPQFDNEPLHLNFIGTSTIFLQDQYLKIKVNDLFDSSRVKDELTLDKDTGRLSYKVQHEWYQYPEASYFLPYYQIIDNVAYNLNLINKYIDYPPMSLRYSNDFISTTGRVSYYTNTQLFINPTKFIKSVISDLEKYENIVIVEENELLSLDLNTISDDLLRVYVALIKDLDGDLNDFLGLSKILGLKENITPFDGAGIQRLQGNLWYPQNLDKFTREDLYYKIQKINDKTREYIYTLDAKKSISDENIMKSVALFASLEFNKEFSTLSEKILPQKIDTKTYSLDYLEKSMMIPKTDLSRSISDSLYQYTALRLDWIGPMLVFVDTLTLSMQSGIRVALIVLLWFVFPIIAYINYVWKNRYYNKSYLGLILSVTGLFTLFAVSVLTMKMRMLIINSSIETPTAMFFSVIAGIVLNTLVAGGLFYLAKAIVKDMANLGAYTLMATLSTVADKVNNVAKKIVNFGNPGGQKEIEGLENFVDDLDLKEQAFEKKLEATNKNSARDIILGELQQDYEKVEQLTKNAVGKVEDKIIENKLNKYNFDSVVDEANIALNTFQMTEVDKEEARQIWQVKNVPKELQEELREKFSEDIVFTRGTATFYGDKNVLKEAINEYRDLKLEEFSPEQFETTHLSLDVLGGIDTPEGKVISLGGKDGSLLKNVLGMEGVEYAENQETNTLTLINISDEQYQKVKSRFINDTEFMVSKVSGFISKKLKPTFRHQADLDGLIEGIDYAYRGDNEFILMTATAEQTYNRLEKPDDLTETSLSKVTGKGFEKLNNIPRSIVTSTGIIIDSQYGESLQQRRHLNSQDNVNGFISSGLGKIIVSENINSSEVQTFLKRTGVEFTWDKATKTVTLTDMKNENTVIKSLRDRFAPMMFKTEKEVKTSGIQSFGEGIYVTQTKEGKKFVDKTSEVIASEKVKATRSDVGLRMSKLKKQNKHILDKLEDSKLNMMKSENHDKLYRIRVGLNDKEKIIQIKNKLPSDIHSTVDTNNGMDIYFSTKDMYPEIRDILSHFKVDEDKESLRRNEMSKDEVAVSSFDWNVDVDEDKIIFEDDEETGYGIKESTEDLPEEKYKGEEITIDFEDDDEDVIIVE